MKWITLVIVLGILAISFYNTPKAADLQPAEPFVITKSADNSTVKLTKYIARNYKISKPQAYKIVSEAEKQANVVHFLDVSDILAIIAIESRFQQHAVSSSNALGLMQILYKRSSTDIEHNIRDGVSLLKTYYRLTKQNKDSTIQAYNVGIGAFYSGTRSTEYLKQFKKHKQKFEEIQ